MIRVSVRPSQARRRPIHSLVLRGLVLATAATGSLAGPAMRGAAAQEGGTIRVADRCSLYGANFVDIGDGTCVRVVRQYGEAAGLATPPAATSHAALRSDGMLPGAADAGHLRVPGGFYGR